MGTHIVMAGNPLDGFVHFGPFATHGEALEWAEVELLDDTWFVVPLHAAERGNTQE